MGGKGWGERGWWERVGGWEGGCVGGWENGRVGVWEGESEGGVKGGDVEEMRRRRRRRRRRKGWRDGERGRGREQREDETEDDYVCGVPFACLTVICMCHRNQSCSPSPCSLPQCTAPRHHPQSPRRGAAATRRSPPVAPH